MARMQFLTPGGPVVLNFKTDAELADMLVQTRTQFAEDGEANFGWANEGGDGVTYFLIPSSTALMFEFDGDVPDDLRDRIEKARSAAR
ncbi:hypothetical protein I6I76_09925 [Dermacoccus nishinomiyaensis]|uniref:hypothetical protein n=2 Tax=Dermacoccus nishinomiyaensis TaxID=1274 RepID=UPI000E043F2C|nr:hypothetical protein [Dermacoccus nishinomiyaensis]QQY23849.1 hypothetical protein I6I76_09925 [Dermacoccus nishinomiyaensis]STD12168.1 Uncharacterised protein [Dermacoccus nishinomiyaensis]STD12608.1 Uncharacterised protein [Dermacoccus nishinomiyaensis]